MSNNNEENNKYPPEELLKAFEDLLESQDEQDKLESYLNSSKKELSPDSKKIKDLLKLDCYDKQKEEEQCLEKLQAASSAKDKFYKDTGAEDWELLIVAVKVFVDANILFYKLIFDLLFDASNE